MCFSASASFVASGLIGAGGVGTLKEKISQRDIPFASIPIIFAVQQLCEGFVWIYFGSGIEEYFAFAFLFVALIFWPFFVPFSVYYLETEENRRSVLQLLSFLGGFLSLYFLVFLVKNGLKIDVIESSLIYDITIPFAFWVRVLYGLLTVGSCLVSSRKVVRVFGILLGVSLMIAFWINKTAAISVWCFFAAVMSIWIYVGLKQFKKEKLLFEVKI